MKIALVADDLTGANNAGVRLMKQGFSTATIVHGASKVPASYDAICIDTDSRYVSVAEARERVTRAVLQAREHGAELVCKRIDTLLRGNVGAEIDATLDVSPGAIAIVAAAFPETNRVVRDGHLLVDGEPVHRNAVAASDPIAPVKHSYIPTIIGAQSRAPVATLGLEVVMRGIDAVAAAIEAAAAAGTRIIVVDAISRAHVQTLAEAMALMMRPLIPVDPGVLSAAYAKARFAGREGAGHKVLMCVGSTTALTFEQLKHALAHFGVEATYVRAEQLAGEAAARDQEMKSAAAAALQRLKDTNVCVVTTVNPSGPLNLQARAAADGTTPQLVAKRIAQGLARIGCDIIAGSRGAIGGCYSSGGDVTAALYAEARGEGFEIVDEVVPLVSHVRLLGGPFDGLLMVTKGGSVGTASTASDCVRFLLSRLGAPAAAS